MGDIAPRPDLPGSLDFVCRYIDANFDGAGTILTMTNPPPIVVSRLDMYCTNELMYRTMVLLADQGQTLDV